MCSSFIFLVDCLRIAKTSIADSRQRSMFASEPDSCLAERYDALFRARLQDFAEEEGYPPCLVFERGDVTLDKWIDNTDPRSFQRKEALLQVEYSAWRFWKRINFIGADGADRSAQFQDCALWHQTESNKVLSFGASVEALESGFCCDYRASNRDWCC